MLPGADLFVCILGGLYAVMAVGTGITQGVIKIIVSNMADRAEVILVVLRVRVRSPVN